MDHVEGLLEILLAEKEVRFYLTCYISLFFLFSFFTLSLWFTLVFLHLEMCVALTNLSFSVGSTDNLVDVNGVHWNMFRFDMNINFLGRNNEWKVSSFAWVSLDSLIWEFLLSHINIWTTTTWSNVWVILPKPSRYEFLMGFLIWTPAPKYMHLTTLSNICVIFFMFLYL